MGEEITRWILPTVLVVVGIVLGLLSEGILMVKLRKLARAPQWDWVDLLFRSLHRMTFVWFAAGGVYAAMLASRAETSPEVRMVIRSALLALVLLTFTIVAARLAGGSVRLWSQGAEGGLPSSSLLQNVARILVFVVGVIFILQNLGIAIGPLLAGLGIGGLAVALALQDTLANLFSGFQIILARQIREGDYVRLESGEEGFVTDIKWRNSTIRSRVEDHEVIIPNSTLANSIVTNYNLPTKPYWARLEVGVGYESDLENVERVTLEVAREVLEEHGLKSPVEPLVRFHTFGDSSVNFRVRLRIEEFGARFVVVHTLVKRLHARYREEGIEIPFPIRTLFAPRGVEVREAEARKARAGEPS